LNVADAVYEFAFVSDAVTLIWYGLPVTSVLGVGVRGIWNEPVKLLPLTV
jgi:hypothetical protein